MFEQIATFATRLAKRRTHAPIRRNSKPAGQCEEGIWKKTEPKALRDIVLAARRYEIANKAPGARNGPLGAIAIEVLELLSNCIHHQSGRLDPSIDYMVQKLRRSRDAIVRGLAALRAHGFVDWIRRFLPAESAGDKGPQVRQTSNAYKLSMPPAARAALGRYGKAVPRPDDQVTAAVEQARQQTEYEAIDNPVAASLERLRKARKVSNERESAERTESLSVSLYLEERTPLTGSLTLPCGGSGPGNMPGRAAPSK